MVAVGNAIATKKDMNIRADQMTAFYESSKKGGEKARTNIRDVHAQGGVVITSPTAKAYGDTMDYNLITDVMVLQGEPVSKILTNDGKTITATDNITYYPSENKAIAFGDVIAKNDDSTITQTKWSATSPKTAKDSLNWIRSKFIQTIMKYGLSMTKPPSPENKAFTSPKLTKSACIAMLLLTKTAIS